MLNALKKLDKKFLIMAVVIICLPILLIIFLAIVQGCSNRKITYEKYETKMIEAAQKYIEDTDKTPTEEGELLKVKLSLQGKRKLKQARFSLIFLKLCKRRL